MMNRGSLKLGDPQTSSPLTAQPSPASCPDQRRAKGHDATGRAGYWWLAASPDLPLHPPHKASPAPARTIGGLNAFLHRSAAPDVLRAASLTWLNADQHGSCTTPASYIRAYLHERGRTPGLAFVAFHRALLRPSFSSEPLRRSARRAAIPPKSSASPAVSRHRVAAALVHPGEPPAALCTQLECAAGAGTDRAVIRNAALQHCNAHLEAGSTHRKKQYRR
ncbi:hypothetical protein GCM10022419_105890 [Nonomuraea rosea]|uniref:Uncharacterized protein n=1 Tax=Nonomuraea rosea TaxID=638574 RepID=A0ABP6ZBB7_9ACTN